MDPAGKTAVVTGAASGIGFALASQGARLGMRLVLADVDEAALDEAVERLTAAGTEVIGIPTDVRDESSVLALRDAAFERFDTVHVVFNNAGVLSGIAPAWTIPASEWRWVLEVNVLGVVHGIRAFVPRLVEQREGHVVNTASSAGLTPGHSIAAYAASKHAVVSVSETLANDLADAGIPVGVSVLCPSFVRTRIVDAQRLRPEGVESTDALDEQSRAWRDFLTTGTDTGLEPDEVATHAYDAIRSGRFYVTTHPHTGDAVRRRLEAILSGELPRRATLT